MQPRDRSPRPGRPPARIAGLLPRAPPSCWSSGHQMTTNRSNSIAAPLRPPWAHLRDRTHSPSSPFAVFAVAAAVAVATTPEPAGSQSEHSVSRPADRRPLTRTSARRPCRCPWPRPIPCHSTPPPTGPGPPLGPVADVLDQHHQRRLALTGPGAQVPGRVRGPGRAGAPGRRRHRAADPPPPRPTRARVRHEDHPAQVDAELGRRDHPGIGQADRGAPAPGLRRRGQQGQGQRGGTVAGQPGHGGRRPPPQRPIGEERGQGRRHRQEPSGHRRGRADPIGQADRKLPGTGRRPPSRASRWGLGGKANICSYTTENVPVLLMERQKTSSDGDHPS